MCRRQRRRSAGGRPRPPAGRRGAARLAGRRRRQLPGLVRSGGQFEHCGGARDPVRRTESRPARCPSAVHGEAGVRRRPSLGSGDDAGGLDPFRSLVRHAQALRFAATAAEGGAPPKTSLQGN